MSSTNSPQTPKTPGSSARRRAVANAPAWLQPGSKVEVRIDEDGFRGAWYSAEIQRRIGRTRCEVAYSTLMSDDDPSQPLVESVRIADLRPCPEADNGGKEYELYELVEGFHNDGWWGGVISGVACGEGGMEYRVAFPTSREEITLRSELLRPMIRWQGESDEEEAEGSGFIAGADVEVSRDRAKFGKTWFPAQVKKVIKNTVFLVEYQNIKRDGHDSELLTEIVDVQNVRPLRVLDLSVDFSVKDEVEVFIEDGWSPGFVTRILEYSQYTVKLDHHDKEIEFNKAAMRPKCQWNGSDWVLTRKRKTKETGSGKKSAERKETSHGNANLVNDSGPAPKSYSSLAKQRNTNESIPGDQTESAKSSSVLKENISEPYREVDNFLDGDSIEYDDNQTIKSGLASKTLTKTKALEKEKKPDDNFYPDGISKELIDGQQAIGRIPEVPLQGEVHLVIDAEKSIHLSQTPKLDIVLNDEECDFVRLAEWRSSLIGQNNGWNCKKKRKKLFVRRPKTKLLTDSAHTELGSEFSEQHIDGTIPVGSRGNSLANMSLDLSKSIEVSLEKNGNMVSEELASREIMIRCDRPLILKSSPAMSPSKNMEPPFSKKSDLWQVIESMEVFKKVPQQPHFQPLEKYAMEFREGLAIGLMISFVNLVSSVQQLHVDDPATVIQGKFELITCLDENGFNIQFLRSRLEKLLEFQASQMQFRIKKSSLNAAIFEKNEDNARIDALIAKSDNTISEMEEKLRQARDERSSLYLQRQKIESEISIMQKDACDTEGAYNSAADFFTASLASFW